MSRILAQSRGFYPEREAPDETGLDRAVVNTLGHLRRVHLLREMRLRTMLRNVERVGKEIEGLGDAEREWQLRSLRRDLRVHGFTPDLVCRAFAVIRAVSQSCLGLRPYDVQLIGGWAMLQGMIAEMRTGEGKTLVATLPACTVALAGVPVHVITVNDYLAQRDADWMRPVYEALGLTVGTIVQGMELDERRHAYSCDVTYCTNKEIVFDYLRDRLQLGRRPGPVETRVQRMFGKKARLSELRLRGLCFGIVDEADSVLIDEARTPLIISGVGDNRYQKEAYGQALELGDRLDSGADYYVDFTKKRIEMTDGGKERLEDLGEELGGIWNARLRREELVRLALAARHLYTRDKHYVVRDEKVEIVDEYTGRIMPNRSWEGGLHQLVEAKEGVELTAETEVLGRISYQRFFRRYLALAGMTGTAKEATAEFWSVYRRDVMRIRTNRKMCLRGLPTRVYSTIDEKWEAIVERIRALHGEGRPILVGTRTVAASEHLARLLAEAEIPCRVLNALQDDHEAEIVAEAGQSGQVTVATNMAGRGTDIKLGDGVAELGGLHVMITEPHDAGRIDRQLWGRAGRQGDPGSYETFLSMEDELLRSSPARVLGIFGRKQVRPHSALGRALARALVRRSQHAAERRHFRIRKDLLQLDENVMRSLAFSGRGE
ncbi:MAG: preprotein translocase subunit SecA [bacterium]|nr:preprotein translocase subunit SecA [bacterium]